MHAFGYHRPVDLKEASALLKKSPESKLLAGGQSLIPALKQRLAAPSDVIDLRGVSELRGITVKGGFVTIGAMTRHAEVAASKEVANAIPALAQLAGGIGDPQVRNSGTLGGSIANDDPAADYPAGVLGLGATVHTAKRKIAADDFFVGMFETALEPGEIITAVSFPVPQKAAYAKFANPASRFAIVGVMVSQGSGGVRVAVTGAAPSVFRATEMEKALSADFSPRALEAIQVPASGLNSDIHAGADYRAHLITVMAQRAVAAALAGK
jgi:carbon-monoxide dehydrogenase medium subunit